MPVFQQIINVVAYTLSVLTFMSPIPSLYKSWRRRDLGELSFVPFAAMVVNSFLWVSYAWLSDDIFPLLATYACCEALSISYVVVYATLTPQKMRVAKIMAVGVAAIALVGTYIALARSGVTNQSRDSTATTVGVVANVASFVMYSSPFETIARVVRTKNASSMPIHLCLVGAIGNTAWVIYAVLVMDIIILVPNVICSLVGWVQVIMYWIYRPGRFAGDVTIGDDKPMGLATSPVVDMLVVVESPDANSAFSAANTPSQALQ